MDKVHKRDLQNKESNYLITESSDKTNEKLNASYQPGDNSFEDSDNESDISPH